MAEEPILLDLTRSVYSYIYFITKIRERARDPQRHSHNLPVLPHPPQNQEQAETITLELRAGGNSLMVIIRRHDLYLIGYRMQNGQWFEFQRNDGIHLIQNSVYLGFGENYIALGGLNANSFQVGYNVLYNAINRLLVESDNNERRFSLRLLCVMLCEAARFRGLADHFSDLVRHRTDESFQGWMRDLIHSWGDLSDRLLRSDVFPVGFRLPPGPNGDMNILSMPPLNINSADTAVLQLGLLLGSFDHTLHLRIRREVRSDQNPFVQSVGQPMVEVFSVRINNIDNENPGQLYGTIQVTDGLGSFYLYNRASNDYEDIHPDEIASLVGPYRSISLCQSFSVQLDLKDKDSLSPDDEISKGYITSDVYSRSTTQSLYDKPLSGIVTGEYGKATVYYAMLSDALEATVQVILINGDGEDPADVYGSLVALYRDDFYLSTDQNEKKFYRTLLFNKLASSNLKVRPGNPIPLSRSVVAVPISSTLIIEADLWDYDIISADDEIAKGNVEFSPLPNMSTEKEINGKYGKIIVRITWSPISGGLN